MGTGGGGGIVAILMGLIVLGSATKCPKQRMSPGREIICYTSVNDTELLTTAICKCTTLVHQGHDVRNVTASEIEPIRKSLKEIFPALQLVISVDDSSRTLLTSATIRQETAARLAGVLKEVDGVELNVTAGSKERLFHFVKSLKDELSRKKDDKRIFLALPTRSEELAKQIDFKELSKYVDLFTVATHYLVDDDEAYYTFHPSRMIGLFDMLNTDSLVDLITGLGGPKKKILISLPAGAYRFTLKNDEKNAPRSPTVERDPVIIDRKELCGVIAEGEWTIERDEDLTAPYAFKNKTWIAFEDKISAGIKGKYAMIRDLAGMGIRNVERDFQTDCEKPLTHEVHHSFMNFKRKTREAVLSSLEDDLHQAQITYSNHAKSSDFRIVRVVDTDGHIRAVREATQTEFTCNRQGYFVHPRSCNRFYRCVKFNQEIEEYSVFEFDCPAGLSFDESTEVCVWPHTLPQGSPCPGSSEIAPVTRVRFECPAEPGYYADPQNCRWFFACIDLGGPQLMAYEFRCPFGLVFDQEKLACEWPWLVPGCSDSGTGYTRSEYDSGAYGSTYLAGGGASHEYSQTTGYSKTGEYSNNGYADAGSYQKQSPVSGFSGPAGVYYGSTGGTSAHGGSADTGGSVGSTGGTSAHADSADTGYVGSTGGQYNGYTGGSHETGPVGGTYGGVVGGTHGSIDNSGYTGGAGDVYSGTVSHGEASGSVYSGSTSSKYGGRDEGIHRGTSGSGYTKSTSDGYGGSVAGSYGGSTGSAYSEGTSGAYAGASIADGAATTIMAGYGGKAGSAYFGETSGAYAGASIAGAAASSTTKYGQSNGYSDGQSTIHGYTGSTGGDSYSGPSGISYSEPSHGTYSGPSAGVYQETTGGDYSKVTSGGYSGTTGTTYSAATGGSYSGTTGTSYSGATGGSYSRTTDTAYSGATGGSYLGTTGAEHYVPGSFTGSAGYAGSTGSVYLGETGEGYSRTTGTGNYAPQSTTGSVGYAGSTGSVYTGTGAATQGGYSGQSMEQTVSTGPDYSALTGPRYTGSVASDGGVYTSVTGHATDVGASTETGYSGTGYTSASSVTGGQSPVSGGIHYNVPSTISSSGPGHTISTGSKQNYVPIYASSGTTGTGLSTTNDIHYTGSAKSSIGTTGPTYVPTGYTPGVTLGHDGGYVGVSYLPSSSIPTSGPPSSETLYTTSQGSQERQETKGYVSSEGTFEGPGYSIHPSISTTYPDSIVTHGYTTHNAGQSTAKGIFTLGTATDYTGTGTGMASGFAKEPGRNGLLNITILGHDSHRKRPHFGPPRHPTGYTTAGGTTGTIITGSTIQGSIHTGDSSSGTLITHGDVSGGISSGPSDQGSIITDTNEPGYVKTDAAIPGYVVSGGVETIYTGSGTSGTITHGTASPGIVLTGTPSPGVTLTGPSSPGLVITGQTGPGVVIGGSVEPGKVVGDTTGSGYVTGSSFSTYNGGSSSVNTGSVAFIGTVKNGFVPEKTTSSQSTGYKTNEYHDNGGRGTIKFNNGYVTSKYTENDIPDYRPSVGTLPDPIVSGGRIEGTDGVILDTALSGAPTQPFAPVTSGYSPSQTGEQAFHGNVAGYTESSTRYSGDVGSLPTSTTGPTFGTSTESHRMADRSHIDTSRITLGPSASSGYVYPQPKTPFVTGDFISSTPSPTVGNMPVPFTTPTPFLNVEVHNTPSTLYGPSKPTNVQYTDGSFGTTQLPSGFTGGKSPIRTPAPTLYTTGPLENFKTTVFESVKLPVRTSTIQPVIDTAYKTIVSPTRIPVTVVDDRFTQRGSSFHAGSTSSQEQTSYEAGVSYQQTGFDDQRDHTSVTLTPQVHYVPPSTNSPLAGSTSIGTYGQSITPGVYQKPSSTFQPPYVPTSTVSPAVGVAYSKPSSVPGVTYEKSTGQPTLRPGYTSAYSSDGTSTGTFYDNSYSTGTRTTFGSRFVTGASPMHPDIPREEVEKLVTNYDRGPVKYVPTDYDTYEGGHRTETTKSFSTGYSDRHSSTSAFSSTGQTYVGHISLSPTERPYPEVTSYPRSYGRVTGSTPSYEVTTKSTTTAVSKGKVIVKWSDLHPLLLGKLGAQCTCRGDPFANLRGPAKKLIPSSNGAVDLSTYDESDVYVDLENENSNDYDGDYVTNYGSTSPAPFKIHVPDNPARGSPFVKTVDDGPAPAYLPSPSSSSAREVNSFVSGARSGKSLNNRRPSANSVNRQVSFNQNGIVDEVLQSVSDCARPGLFRHPNFCNKFYACHWDDWKKKFTLHVFNCPVHLTFDNNAGACNWPSKGPACQDDNLLV